ncbi:putative kinetochore-associated protein DSN1-like [Apostichopus japonicus]|uniref:Putative kinetochore-associated protein DSN1-like n=1 Tax=Stichopus japonicus TaxID=307972 RepID=A0A2G8JP37_STIJA|nr:putative kinetochore-associated protein DSN1-like [Apostichopus japonicus]
MEGRKRLTRSAAKSHPQQLQSENNEASSPLLIKRRRTMPSKYEPNYGERLEQKQQNTPTDPKSDKKRRRSSFVRGRSRKSIGVVNTEVTEIHMKIPMDETPEERLRLLKLACFEYTMNKLHEEFPILETMENFRPTGKEEFHKSLQELVEDGTLKSACYSNSRNENPLNLEMETHISQLDERIKTLRDESKQWDEMLTSYTQRTEEATAK